MRTAHCALLHTSAIFLLETNHHRALFLHFKPYRGEGDLEGEFLRRRRLSPCLARPGDLERDNDLDREDSARRPYLLPGDRDLPIFRCAPMHAAVKRRRAAVEGQCQLLSSEKTSAPPQSFWKICFWKSFLENLWPAHARKVSESKPWQPGSIWTKSGSQASLFSKLCGHPLRPKSHITVHHR